jgi:hypothetical protein
MRFKFLLVILLINTNICLADKIGYNEIVDFGIESKNYIIRHYHNWSDSTSEQRWKMMSSGKNPFTGKNNYSFVECTDKRTGQVTFRVPMPAFTIIEIDSSEKYIVCISKIKLMNPYQFVLLNIKGEILKKINTDKIRALPCNKGESVTNWIHWYDEEDPGIKFSYRKDSAILDYITIYDLKHKKVIIKV